MKLLFCHDGPMEKTSDGKYHSLCFNDSLCKRYEVISDDISIAMRVHCNNIRADKVKKSQLLSDKYKIIECPNISSIKGLFFNKKKCKVILNKAVSNSDAVIVRLPSFIGNLAIDACKKLRKPYLVELVGCPWDSLRNRSLVGKVIAPIMFLKTKRRIRHSPYVVYVTESFLQHRYPTNGKNISCSDVELPRIALNMKSKRIDPKKIIKLGTIGKLDVKYKGQQYVIKAIKELKNSGLSIKYSIVGPGDPSYLRRVAKKNGVIDDVEFCGELSHEKIFEWLSSIDIYIQPSTTEGMPRSLIEAMSVGCICLSSDVGGMPELLERESIFRSKKHKDIARTIIKNISNDERMQSRLNVKKFEGKILKDKRNVFLIDFSKGVVNG